MLENTGPRVPIVNAKVHVLCVDPVSWCVLVCDSGATAEAAWREGAARELWRNWTVGAGI